MEANLQVLQHERVPLTTLRDFSALFVTYATEYEPLAAFYAGDYRDPAVRRERAARVAAHPRDRAILVEVLQEQNARWGLDAATRKHIEALRDSDSVALVTGQQVGLLGGPLFTLYKALTVGKLARRLADELDRPVVPVFWLAGEDHDYEEVASVTVLKGAEPVTLRLERPDPDYAGPVGRLPLPETIQTLLDELADLLPPTEFQEPLLALLYEIYRPGVSFQDAFARLLKRLVLDEVGLVLIDPDDARLKALARPLFERELTDWETAHARLEAVSRELAARYHVQVQTRPLNLFLLEDHRRIPLDAEPDGFHLRGEDRVLSRAEAWRCCKSARTLQSERPASAALSGLAAAHVCLRGGTGRDRLLGSAQAPVRVGRAADATRLSAGADAAGGTPDRPLAGTLSIAPRSTAGRTGPAFPPPGEGTARRRTGGCFRGGPAATPRTGRPAAAARRTGGSVAGTGHRGLGHRAGA